MGLGNYAMIHVPKRRLILPRRQRGNLNLFPAGSTAVTAEGGVVPLVTDILLDHSDGTAANNVGIIFNDVLQAVGAINTIVARRDLVYSEMGNDDAPVDHTGEWTPNAGVDGSLFEVACTSLTMGTWSSEPAAVGVYTSLDTENIIWNVNRPGGKGRTPGTTQVIGDFRLREIADPGGNFTDFEVDVTNTQT